MVFYFDLYMTINIAFHYIELEVFAYYYTGLIAASE